MKTILRGTILWAAGWSFRFDADGAGTRPCRRTRTKAGQPMAMPMPQPAPEMTKMIKIDVGHLECEREGGSSPMFPRAASGKGTAKMWAGPGGMSLMETILQRLDGTALAVRGRLWDAKAGLYHGICRHQ